MKSHLQYLLYPLHIDPLFSPHFRHPRRYSLPRFVPPPPPFPPLHHYHHQCLYIIFPKEWRHIHNLYLRPQVSIHLHLNSQRCSDQSLRLHPPRLHPAISRRRKRKHLRPGPNQHFRLSLHPHTEEANVDRSLSHSRKLFGINKRLLYQDLEFLPLMYRRKVHHLQGLNHNLTQMSVLPLNLDQNHPVNSLIKLVHHQVLHLRQRELII